MSEFANFSNTPPSVDPEQVRSEVKGAALSLIVVGALGLLTTCCCGFPWSVNPFLQDLEVVPIDWAEGMYRSGPPRPGSFLQAFGGGCGNLLGLILNGMILYGGLQMRSLKNFSFARSAAIAALIPIQCCFIASVPVGIWALMILSRPEVKNAFTPD